MIADLKAASPDTTFVLASIYPVTSTYKRLNLINNAIKYGSDGKRIDVKIQANPETVTVSVINYGKVIPEEELPHLFEKFYRVEQSRNKTTGGTGLGLAIAKSIVDMHDGDIRVESDLNGTRFIVTLKINFDKNREHFESAK